MQEARIQDAGRYILLVDDEPAHAEAVRRAFDAAGLNGSIQVAGTLREYRELVAVRPPEIAIVDLNLPDGRALEVLSWPPEAGAFPVVVMTSYGNQQVAVEAMKGGALDYVVKSPEAFAGMPRTVERALREWGLLQERRRAEEALRTEKDRAQRYLDIAGVVLVSLAPDRTIVLINRKGCDLLGYTQEELLGKNWIDTVIPEREREKVKALFVGLIDGELEALETVENLVVTRSGEERIVAWHNGLERDASGVIVRTLSSGEDITWRRRAEEALRLSHERFQLANRATFNAIWGWDFQTNALLWNETFQTLFGYRAEEIEPNRESWTNRIHPEDLDRVETGIRAAIDWGQQFWNDHYRFRRKDGAYAEVEDRGYIARDAKGRPVRMIGAMQDVTERKRAERALTLHTRVAVIFASISGDEMFNEVLKVVLDVMQSPLGVFGYIDEDGALVAPTMTRQAWDQCQIAGKAIKFPPATWSDSSWLPAIREKRTIYSNEASTGVPEGQVGILRHVSLPIVSQGEVIGILQAANKETDYTEEDVRTLQAISGQVAPILQARLQHMRAEEALRENELRFHTLADSGQALIWTSGLDRKCDYFNRPWLEFTGRALEQELGDGWTEGVHPDDLERSIGIYTGAFDRRERFSMDYRLRAHDGEYRWIQDDGTPRHDSQGNFLGYIGHCLDITGRRRAGEALLRRTEELARSNAELEQFARVASHDLKEPLRMVSSYTQLLARRYHGKLGADADEFIAYAADGALRMQQLIDDLLAYARVSAREREFQTISSEAALSTALQNLAAAIQESGAVIRSGPLPPVCADPVQLGQVFQNLVGNAIKFRKSATPHIDVACQEDPGEWRFSVSDNGIGIDPKSADRIFEVFQRLHTRKEYPGTGIGLAICKKIAEQHGGRIWVASQPGQGAAFQFTIRKDLGERG